MRLSLSEYIHYKEVSYEFSRDKYVIYNDADEVELGKSTYGDLEAKIGDFVRFVGASSVEALNKFNNSRFNSADTDYKPDQTILSYKDNGADLGKILYVKAPTLAGENLDNKAQIDGQLGKYLPVKKIYLLT